MAIKQTPTPSQSFSVQQKKSSEPVRKNDVAGQNLGSAAKFVPSTTRDFNGKDVKRGGSLASELAPGQGGGEINVIKDYTWTLSNPDVSEVPYVLLNEYKCTESQIKRQLDFYTKVTAQKATNAAAALPGGTTSTTTEILDVYNEVFPKDNPTGFRYRFPYFNKIGFELSTPAWSDLDSLGESISKITGGFGKVGEVVNAAINAADAVANTMMAAQYPSIGVVDRPKIFMSHNERNITISFTLYNTRRSSDWKENRNLAYTLMSQNLFNKRDYITGVPPVFYDILIPGQYYCYAAAMTNIKVENLGNQRIIDNMIVPDAYQFELTLSELVKPSKNQFEALINGAAQNKVTTGTKQG